MKEISVHKCTSYIYHFIDNYHKIKPKFEEFMYTYY